MLGLTAIAALAVMAYVASTASADRLCEEKISDTAACPAAKQVVAGSKIAGLDTDAVLLDGSKKVLLLCASETLGEVTNAGGAGVHVLGSITKLLFTSCKTLCTKAHGINLPYHIETNVANLHALVKKEGAALGAIIEGCPLSAKCTYSVITQPALLKFENESDFLIANEIPLILANPGLCSFFAEKGFWDAKYLITLDTAEGHVIPLYPTSG
jgi:hypothetical protein